MMYHDTWVSKQIKFNLDLEMLIWENDVKDYVKDYMHE